MKLNIISALLLTLCSLFLFSGLYTLVVWGVAYFAPNHGKGEIVQYDENHYGYLLIGQSFTQEKYFWSRPSAVGYNAAGSAGSNKGPTNPEYIAQVHGRLDSLLAHHPGKKASDISIEMVTASGSGLDPEISANAALLQVERIARIRQIPVAKVIGLISKTKQSVVPGSDSPEKINVLRLNCSLDAME